MSHVALPRFLWPGLTMCWCVCGCVRRQVVWATFSVIVNILWPLGARRWRWRWWWRHRWTRSRAVACGMWQCPWQCGSTASVAAAGRNPNLHWRLSNAARRLPIYGVDPWPASAVCYAIIYQFFKHNKNWIKYKSVRERERKAGQERVCPSGSGCMHCKKRSTNYKHQGWERLRKGRPACRTVRSF